MNNNLAIEVKDLGIKFDLFHKLRRKSSTLKEVLINFTKLRDGIEEFWALRNISFSIVKGDFVGIIGKNGSGKSTLLKIMTGTLIPDEGYTEVYGILSALLELGAGFNPDLDGRENIYLNGAILGMGKRKMDEKFDNIVEFSGLEKFLDTPLRHYSSGMKVRLGFSIAAHLDPDILLIDEVFAVGDKDFHEKCYRKIEEFISKGKTLVLVTHELPIVERYCNECILLENGNLKALGEPKEVIERYVNG